MEVEVDRKKFFVVGGVLLLLLAGGVLFYASQRQQDIRQRAAVSEGGKYHIFLVDPATTSHPLNQTFPTEIRLSAEEPAQNKIAALSLSLYYTYGGEEPELKVVDPDTGEETDQVVLSDVVKGSTWSCPTNHISKDTNAKKVTVEVLCVNTGEGFAAMEYDSSSPTSGNLIATINFKASTTPDPNPVTISFDQAESIVTRKEDGKDYLVIPNSASLTIGEGGGQCAGKPSADINCDGKVDLVDLTTVARNWGTSPQVARADTNGDSKVDITDLTTVARNWTR